MAAVFRVGQPSHTQGNAVELMRSLLLVTILQVLFLLRHGLLPQLGVDLAVPVPKALHCLQLACSAFPLSGRRVGLLIGRTLL